MSQQAATGRAAPVGRRGGKVGRYFGGRGDPPSKGFNSSISEIANDTFNNGKNNFSAQFTQSKKDVANYLQCTAAKEGYLVAEMVRTGKAQTIALPPPVDVSTAIVKGQKNYTRRGYQGDFKAQSKIKQHAEEGLRDNMGSVFLGGR
jgi:hypothetical protein